MKMKMKARWEIFRQRDLNDDGHSSRLCYYNCISQFEFKVGARNGNAVNHPRRWSERWKRHGRAKMAPFRLRHPKGVSTIQLDDT
jgi:hypothetical protein